MTVSGKFRSYYSFLTEKAGSFFFFLPVQSVTITKTTVPVF